MKGFISYSHRDEPALIRLHTHLSVLRREGLIETWFDRDILAGQNIDLVISKQLHDADLFLLLVSPDFLASPYCSEREMQHALDRHATGSATVVPIIVEPCDWQATSLGDLKAIPTDGCPISLWPNENEAYQNVVSELRRLTESMLVRGNAPRQAARTPQQTTRYRVPRDFGAIDQAEFAQNTFDVIRDRFESNLQEVSTIDGVRTRFLSISATSFTCSVENRNGYRDATHITVHCSNDHLNVGDITYAFQANAPIGMSNGWLSVEHDEYDMFIASMDFRSMNKEQMNSSQAADMLWSIFLEQAGIQHG